MINMQHSLDFFTEILHQLKLVGGQIKVVFEGGRGEVIHI